MKVNTNQLFIINEISEINFKIYKSKIMFGLNKDNANEQVGELVEKLKSNVGLSEEQAQKVLETIKTFVVDKYPMLQGAVNNIFGDN